MAASLQILFESMMNGIKLQRQLALHAGSALSGDLKKLILV